tara:strand:- start:52 stop:846 length:795 start_codon:yes stop_codon:yes gene_type:complete
MKKLILILASTLFIILSCKTTVNTYEASTNYDISPLEWFKCHSCEPNYDNTVSQFINDNKISWNPFSSTQLKNEDFINSIHNSLKKVGYSKLITQSFYTENILPFIDSIEINQNSKNHNYYSKFLLRREAQGNKELFLSILDDIKNEFKQIKSSFDPKLVNDTIVNLLTLDLKWKSLDSIPKKQDKLNLFNKLKNAKFNSYAYNLIFRHNPYSTADQLTDSCFQTIPKDSIKKHRFHKMYRTLGYYKNKKWNDDYFFWQYYEGP